MREPVFKAEFHAKPFYLPEYTRDVFELKIIRWLLENDRFSHLINIYPTDKPGHMIVVLNDRDTAIMLKLALG